MQMRNWLGTLLATLVLVASCGGGDEDASPTTTDAPPTSAVTTTTEAVDPFTVPDDPADITEEYVEAVINEHNRVLGDALRIQLDGGDPQEVIDRYNAIYVPEVADLYLSDAFNEDEASLERYRRPPGDVTVDVSELLEVARTCVVARVFQDSSASLLEPPPPFEGLIVLRARANDDFTSDLNRTAWMSEGLEPLTDPEELRCGG